MFPEIMMHSPAWIRFLAGLFVFRPSIARGSKIIVDGRISKAYQSDMPDAVLVKFPPHQIRDLDIVAKEMGFSRVGVIRFLCNQGIMRHRAKAKPSTRKLK